MIYQRLHGKALVNGHASWVPRVRPRDWDTYVEGNSFLAALTRHELRQDGGTFAFEASDLEELRGLGLRVITVNREMYTYALRDTYQGERELMRALFGDPILRGAYFEAWDVDRWSGETSVTGADRPGPAAVPGSFADNPLPGGPFPAAGFGSLNPRSLLHPLPVGALPRQPRLFDGDGQAIRVEGTRLQTWTPTEQVWMGAGPGVDAP